MRSKRRHEGWLYIENPEHVPFVDEAAALRSGRVWITPPATMTVYENSTITCNHCQQVFIKNSHRTRERAWCWNCDHYICDRCAAVRVLFGCRTFAESAEKNLPILVST